MKKGILLLLITTIAYNLQAQKKPGSRLNAGITGKVIDSASGEPLNYATITLYAIGNPKPINGSITDATGVFFVNDVNDGNYKVVIEYIGYRPVTINNVSIDKKDSPLDLKTISLVKKSGGASNGNYFSQTKDH